MKLRPVILLVPVLLSLPCAAQSAQAAPAAEPTAGIDDVVVVNGWRHPVQLRLQMVEAELAVYDLFNQLTDDNSLKLECARRNVGGTRLQATDCAPRFESQALAAEGQDALEHTRAYLNAAAVTEGNFSAMFPGGQNVSDGNGGINLNAEPFMNYTPMSTAPPAIMQIKAGQHRLKREMQEVAAEHPEFIEAVTKYVNAKERYTQALRRDQD